MNTMSTNQKILILALTLGNLVPVQALQGPAKRLMSSFAYNAWRLPVTPKADSALNKFNLDQYEGTIPSPAGDIASSMNKVTRFSYSGNPENVPLAPFNPRYFFVHRPNLLNPHSDYRKNENSSTIRMDTVLKDIPFTRIAHAPQNERNQYYKSFNACSDHWKLWLANRFASYNDLQKTPGRDQGYYDLEARNRAMTKEALNTEPFWTAKNRQHVPVLDDETGSMMKNFGSHFINHVSRFIDCRSDSYQEATKRSPFICDPAVTPLQLWNAMCDHSISTHKSALEKLADLHNSPFGLQKQAKKMMQTTQESLGYVQKKHQMGKQMLEGNPHFVPCIGSPSSFSAFINTMKKLGQ